MKLRTTHKVMLGVAAAFVAYLIVKRQVNKKEMLKIHNDNVSGADSEKVKSGEISAFDPKFWKSSGVSKSISSFGATAKKRAAEINKLIGNPAIPGTSHEDDLKALFKQFNSQAEVSLTADFYYQLYKRDMASDIKTIDNTLLGIGIFGTPHDAEDIFKIVNALRKG